MKAIDVSMIRKHNSEEDFEAAKKCKFFLYDVGGGPAIWHRCFCDAVPRTRGVPDYCSLARLGERISQCNTG